MEIHLYLGLNYVQYKQIHWISNMRKVAERRIETDLNNLDAQLLVVWVGSVIEGVSHCLLPINLQVTQVVVRQTQPHLNIESSDTSVSPN